MPGCCYTYVHPLSDNSYILLTMVVQRSVGQVLSINAEGGLQDFVSELEFWLRSKQSIAPSSFRSLCVESPLSCKID